MKGVKKDAKDLQQQSGYQRPSLTGALKQSREMMAMAGDVMAQQQATQALLQTGTPAMATLNQFRDTGMTVNENPTVEMDLTVAMDGGTPYQATHTEMVPRLLIPRLVPGSQLPVRADPADPNKIAIDWYRAG